MRGVKIGLKFAMPCILNLQSKGAQGAMFTVYMLYYGYLNYCMIKETEPEYDLEFFSDVVDDSMIENEVNDMLRKVIACFNDSKIIKGLKEKNKPAEEEAEDSKKKLKPTKSKRTVI